MSILVTGCAGFIGAKACYRLLESGNKVIGVDNLNDYYDTRLDVDDLIADVGFKPVTPIAEGIKNFVAWYLDFYRLVGSQFYQWKKLGFVSNPFDIFSKKVSGLLSVRQL